MSCEKDVDITRPSLGGFMPGVTNIAGLFDLMDKIHYYHFQLAPPPHQHHLKLVSHHHHHHHHRNHCPQFALSLVARVVIVIAIIQHICV